MTNTYKADTIVFILAERDQSAPVQYFHPQLVPNARFQ